MQITLVDWPRDLIGTFGKIWTMSRTTSGWEDYDPVEAEEQFFRVLDVNVPVLRFAMFVWMIDDMSVVFREQLVRAKYEDFWIQSMRVQNMGSFEGNMPKSMEGDEAAEKIFQKHMRDSRHAYLDFIDMGYSEEDSRHVIPLAAQHRGSWFTNLQALVERFKKRSCWVTEGIWLKPLTQVRQELVDKVHPGFAGICTPPCFDRGSNEFKGCTVNEMMQMRHDGEEPLPACPLWVHYNVNEGMIVGEDSYIDRCHSFAKLWGRDARTGAAVS